jgi:hypothetical protein
MNGRGQAKQTSNVMAKYPMKWSNCQPSGVRGVQFSGPRAPITSKIMTAPLQAFAPARQQDFISARMADILSKSGIEISPKHHATPLITVATRPAIV